MKTIQRRKSRKFSTIFVCFLLAFVFLHSSINVLFARDVHVNGYTRKDGTYVRPHIRSSPDSTRSNNYGPSRNSSELLNPTARDNDKDGVPNYQDTDDDNDGKSDDADNSQYDSNK